MTSDKQIQANRQNALLGGVKTTEGKEISKINALKHGLLSSKLLLQGERKQELQELAERLKADLNPATEIEMLLVERIIVNVWRLRRALKAEREMMEHDMGTSFRGETLGSALSYDFANSDSYGKFARYEGSIERSIYRALHELQRIQSARAGNNPPAPLAIDVIVDKDGD